MPCTIRESFRCHFVFTVGHVDRLRPEIVLLHMVCSTIPLYTTEPSVRRISASASEPERSAGRDGHRVAVAVP